MPNLTLTPRERAELERLSRHADAADADQPRRANALLALADGRGESAVARAQRVGRSTLSEWVHRFEELRRRDLRAATTTPAPRPAGLGTCGTGSSPGSAS